MAFPSQPQKDFISAVLNHWRNLLYLHQYDFHNDYHEYNSGDDHDPSCSAYIKCRNADQYHYFKIHYYPHFFTFNLEEQEQMILHELCHVLLESLSEMVDRQRNGQLVTGKEQELRLEKVTDWVRLALLAAADGSRYVNEQTEKEWKERIDGSTTEKAEGQ